MRSLSRALLPLLALWLASLALPAPLWAFKPVSASLINERSVAIGGYDPVAYFTERSAVRGSPLLVWEWQGAVWYFRSHRHRKMFQENPERYAPAYGGYCALCMETPREEHLAADPTIFFIYRGRLFLLSSQEVLDAWRQDPEAHIASADAEYQNLLGTAYAEASPGPPR